MKMKTLLATLVLGIASLSLVACGSSTTDSKADTSLSDIQNSGKLIVAVSPDYAPFEFQSLIDGENQVVGADIDLAQKIADELGVELEISVMNFDNVLASLQSGKADIAISGISYSEERAKTFDFSVPYYQTENAMLVKQTDLDNYTDLKDFSGKQVAVLKGTIEENLAKTQLKESTIISLPIMGETINELKAGKVDAVNLEEPVALGYVSHNPDLVIAKVALTVEDGDAKAVAMPKGSSSLKAEIDKIIQDLIEKGEYQTYLDQAAQLTVVE